MKNIFKKVHEMTRKIKREYPEVDYRTQFGICLSCLLKNKKEGKGMELELSELKGTTKQVKWAEDIRKQYIDIITGLINKYETGDKRLLKYEEMQFVPTLIDGRKAERIEHDIEIAKMFLKVMLEITDAKWWIENRRSIYPKEFNKILFEADERLYQLGKEGK